MVDLVPRASCRISPSKELPQMNNKKCPYCSFINFVDAAECRKCQTVLTDLPDESTFIDRPTYRGGVNFHHQPYPTKDGSRFKSFLIGIAGLALGQRSMQWLSDPMCSLFLRRSVNGLSIVTRVRTSPSRCRTSSAKSIRVRCHLRQEAC